MQRKRRKKKRFEILLFLLVFCIGAGALFVPWVMQPENFREVNCSDDEIFVSKSENESKVPASLAKLFVIEYAATFLVGRMPWKAGRRQIIHGIFHGTI